ncbi:MAG: two-component regulator propeller domain-containing protein, partial [Bacteroidota bacterium]
ESLIIGTESNGGFLYSSKTGIFSHLVLVGNSVKNIYRDKKGFVWISTEEHGINRFSPQTGESKHYQLTTANIRPLIDDERHYLFEDSKGQLWIACHGGGLALFDYQSDEFSFFRNQSNNSNSISSNFVHNIIQDKSGNYWVGTSRYRGGLNKIIFPNPAFNNVIPNRNFVFQAENEVRAVYEDSKENLWVASRFGVIHIYDKRLNKTDEILVMDHGRRNNIYTIFEDDNHYIWVGAKPGGVYVSKKPISEYTKGYSKIEFDHFIYNNETDGSLSNENVYSIVKDAFDQIWIGTYGKGVNFVIKHPDGSIKYKNIHSGNSNLSNDYVRNIYCDSKGNLWFGTVFGLNFLSNEKIKNHDFTFDVFLNDPENNQSISYNDIVNIFEDSRHNLWISTYGNGLNKLIENKDGNYFFEQYTKNDGLANDIVYGILEDKEKNLWFSTESGLSVFYPKEARFETFNVSNGLYSSEFSENSCCTLSNKKLVFGGAYGFVIVDIEELKSDNNYQNLVLNNFQLLNNEFELNSKNTPLKKSILFAKEINLKYSQSSFSFEFSALNLTAPEQIQYAYKLENYENGWNFSGNNRTAVYKNVPPGEYIFKVKATNLKGDWDQKERHVAIIILHPWWETKTAKIVYIILLIFLVEISRRIIYKYNRLRTDLKVERRINEIKLKFFTNISHEIRTPLTLIMGPLADIRKIKNLPPSISYPIELMDRHGKRMLRLVNQLLDFRKIQNQKMKLKVGKEEVVCFVREICRNFDQLADQKKITFKYPENNSEIEAWFDREKIDSVLFNLLSNAFKFTPAGKEITVEVSENKKEGNLQIKIEDKGNGISKEKIPLLFQRFTSLASENIDFSGTGIGLAYSYELVKLHKGDILVTSTPGEGSCFTVQLPLGNLHFSNEEIQNSDPVFEGKQSHVNEYEFSTFDFHNIRQSEPHKKKYTILIVEDNPDVKFYVAGILEKFFFISTAANGYEGLEQIGKINPDLVVADIMMPKMNGITMTRKIKEDFAISHIPVVMLTAKSSPHEQIEGIDSGAEAYVLKPFNADYLVSIIQNLLKQREIIFRKFQKQRPLTYDIKITNRDEEFLKKIIETIE